MAALRDIDNDDEVKAILSEQIGAEEFSEYSDRLLEDELSSAIDRKKQELAPASDPGQEQPEGKKTKEKNHHEGHRDRVRNRFLASGIDGFAPHEVLELLLFYTIPRKDTNKIAHELIDRFGSLAGVFNADISELTKITEISENTALLFKLIPSVLPMYYADMNKGVSYSSTGKLKELFKPYFVAASGESFCVACFDAGLRLLSVDTVSTGGTGGEVRIEMRKIMECVMRHNAVMAAVAHNHPGRSSKPSDEDIAVTRKICRLLESVDIKLMDHVIIGTDGVHSMRDSGDIGVFD